MPSGVNNIGPGAPAASPPAAGQKPPAPSVEGAAPILNDVKGTAASTVPNAPGGAPKVDAKGAPIPSSPAPKAPTKPGTIEAGQRITAAREGDGFTVGSAPGWRLAISAKLGAPELPIDASGLKPKEISEGTKTVLNTVAEFIDRLRAPGAGKEITDRAKELIADPAQSFLLQEVGQDAAAQLTKLVDDFVADALPPPESMRMVESADSAQQTQQIFDLVATTILTPGAAFLDSLGPKGGSAPGLGDKTPSLNTPERRDDLTHKGLLLIEAGVEFVINKCAEILQGEGQKDLSLLADELAFLKDEKKKIQGRIDGELAKISGIQQRTAAKLRDLERAKEKGPFAIFGDVMTKIKSALFATVLIPLMTTMFQLLLVTKIAGMIPVVGDWIKDKLQYVNTALYTLFMTWGGVLGVDDETLNFITETQDDVAGVIGKDNDRPMAESKEWFDDNLGNNEVYKISVLVASIAVAIVFAIFTGDIGGIAAGIAGLAKLALKAITVVNALTALAQGMAKVEQSGQMKEMAGIMRTVDALRLEMKEVETKIAELIARMAVKRSDEQDVKEDTETVNDRGTRQMESVNKAAESYGAYLRAQTALC